MIRSMTGFASLGREVQGQKVTVTVKSVNHRFLDLALRAPLPPDIAGFMATHMALTAAEAQRIQDEFVDSVFR